MNPHFQTYPVSHTQKRSKWPTEIVDSPNLKIRLFSIGTNGILPIRNWLVVWNHGIVWLSIQFGISSSQLTNSMIFQRGRYATNQIIKLILYIPLYNIPILFHQITMFRLFKTRKFSPHGCYGTGLHSRPRWWAKLQLHSESGWEKSGERSKHREIWEILGKKGTVVQYSSIMLHSPRIYTELVEWAISYVQAMHQDWGNYCCWSNWGQS